MSVIDTRSLTDKVYEYLLNQIITGEVRYGEVINIRKLAQELDISTMPVREAVRRLAFEQIVDIKPRSNCQVRTPSVRMIAEVYELRQVLEMHALQKACGKVPREKLEQLRQIVAQMKELEHVRDADAKERTAIQLDRAFHTEICSLAGNEFMDNFYRQLSLHVNMTFIHKKTFYQLERQYHDSHAHILRSLEDAPEQAPAVLRKHFEDVKRILFEEGQAAGGQEGGGR